MWTWPVGSPFKGSAMQIYDIFFIVSIGKLFNKQSIGRWFETPWRSFNIAITARKTRRIFKVKNVKLV